MNNKNKAFRYLKDFIFYFRILNRNKYTNKQIIGIIN